MAPIKPFLSHRYKFAWSNELEEAFQASKAVIIATIREGVEIFDVHKRTCLHPDWSCKGIGYFLLQQHCDCHSNSPDCCPNGWRITLAGSRFLSSAEQRYAAIEGEALAMAWGLEQTRYFTHGCDDLIVITDHKPLVKLFGDRTVDEITNSRLFCLKQCTLPWRFTIQHSPGKSNHAADATSRHPPPSGNIDCISVPDVLESIFMAAIERDAHGITTLPWTCLAQETVADSSMAHLVLLIKRGITEDDKNDPSIAPFWPIHDSLYTQDGVILYKDRVVVPLLYSILSCNVSMLPIKERHQWSNVQEGSFIGQGCQKTFKTLGIAALIVIAMHHHRQLHQPPFLCLQQHHLKQCLPNFLSTVAATT